MDDVRIVLVTAPEEDAPDLARHLVQARLAACANLLPGVHSVYRWQGQVEDSRETLLILKSTLGRIPDLKAAVTRRHSYDVPEFLVLSVEDGLEAYLGWVRSETGGAE